MVMKATIQMKQPTANDLSLLRLPLLLLLPLQDQAPLAARLTTSTAVPTVAKDSLAHHRLESTPILIQVKDHSSALKQVALVNSAFKVT